MRGGRIHALLHAVAAEKAKAGQLLTADRNDFESLLDTVTVEDVGGRMAEKAEILKR